MDYGTFQLSILPDFEPDLTDARTGWIVTPGGQRRRVFVKPARSRDRLAEEAAAIHLIEQRSDQKIAPHLFGILEGPGEPRMVFSYEEGVNLADLMVRCQPAPPLPPWYEPSAVEPMPYPQDLFPLLRDTGKALRALHAIQLAQFGKLTAADPNLYHTSARNFTRQEMKHRLRLGLDKGHLSRLFTEKAERWGLDHSSMIGNDENACLVHYDLHSGNVRVHQRNGIWVYGVLYDFELARGWLPEWDLAGFCWYVQDTLGGELGCAAWDAFLQGYGEVQTDRLRFFEFLRCLSAVAFSERYPDWGKWCQERMERIMSHSEDSAGSPWQEAKPPGDHQGTA